MSLELWRLETFAHSIQPCQSNILRVMFDRARKKGGVSVHIFNEVAKKGRIFIFHINSLCFRLLESAVQTAGESVRCRCQEIRMEIKRLRVGNGDFDDRGAKEAAVD